MKIRLIDISRRMALSAAVLILFVQAAGAAEPPVQAPGTVPPSVLGVTLLTDGEYYPALLEGIGQARQEIALSVFFFRTTGDGLPDVILSHLIKAARRGVRIDAILELGPEGDNVSGDNAVAAEKLKAAGIRVCRDTPDRTTHAKLVVIDRRWLFIGSHNLTQSALRYNREASVRIDSPQLAEAMLRYIRALCPEG